METQQCKEKNSLILPWIRMGSLDWSNYPLSNIFRRPCCMIHVVQHLMEESICLRSWRNPFSLKRIWNLICHLQQTSKRYLPSPLLEGNPREPRYAQNHQGYYHIHSLSFSRAFSPWHLTQLRRVVWLSRGKAALLNSPWEHLQKRCRQGAMNKLQRQTPAGTSLHTLWAYVQSTRVPLPEHPRTSIHVCMSIYPKACMHKHMCYKWPILHIIKSCK